MMNVLVRDMKQFRYLFTQRHSHVMVRPRTVVEGDTFRVQNV